MDLHFEFGLGNQFDNEIKYFYVHSVVKKTKMLISSLLSDFLSFGHSEHFFKENV